MKELRRFLGILSIDPSRHRSQTSATWLPFPKATLSLEAGAGPWKIEFEMDAFILTIKFEALKIVIS